MAATRRRRAAIRAQAGGLSHLDLENLVVSLLAERGDAWPNALRASGYRLHYFDAQFDLIDPNGPDGPRPVQAHPDAIAHHSGRNAILVMECKSGADAGIAQLPEGKSVPADAWAAALVLPRGPLTPPVVKGMLIAEEAKLEHREADIESCGASWLRVLPDRLELRPDNTGDARLAPAIAVLPSDGWPRSFIPFSHEPSDGSERVIGAIGPLILEAAGRGDASVTAEDLARTTHRAVWAVTSPARQKAWTSAVRRALDALAKGPMKKHAVYDPVLGRLTLTEVRAGVPAGRRAIDALGRAIAQEHRRTLRRKSRVRVSKVDQLPLWSDDLA